MAVKLGITTIDKILAISCDTNPSIGVGLIAPVGSFASAVDGSGFYYKSTGSNTGWSLASNLLLINTQPASYEFVLSDANKLVRQNVATANNLTIPLNATVPFKIGTQILTEQFGLGQITFVVTGGVTVNSKNASLKSNGQFSFQSLIKVGTDEWELTGDLEQASIYITATSTNTLTNKRITARAYSVANNASLTPEKNTYDIFSLTAMSANTTINNPLTTVPADGDQIRIRFLDDGTARTLTWGTIYVAKGGIALPSTTVSGKNLMVGLEYNANLAKWNLIALAQET